MSGKLNQKEIDNIIHQNHVSRWLRTMGHEEDCESKGKQHIWFKAPQIVRELTQCDIQCVVCKLVRTRVID